LRVIVEELNARVSEEPALATEMNERFRVTVESPTQWCFRQLNLLHVDSSSELRATYSPL